MRHLEIAMTPAEAVIMPPADCYVVIDVLRATTTMAVLFDRGLETLFVVEELEAAAAARTEGGALLFGERHGIRPEGFDYGNSPVEAATLDLAGRHAIHVTSNGTRALCALASRGPTIAGSLANLSAVTAYVGGFNSAVLVCAGNGGAARFSLEDFATAAVIAQRCFGRDAVGLGDAARLALELESPVDLVGRAEHAGILRGLGFEADVDLAATVDTAAVVPVVREFGPGWCRLERA